MNAPNPLIAAVAGRRVFLTGHTGFKGTWLIHWLHRLGCEITGYALAPASEPAMYSLSGAERLLARSHVADVRDAGRLVEALGAATPELVVHMAAQPLVLRGYAEPKETWDINVTGTVNLLEAARASNSVRAIIVVTTDKVYENHGWLWGYREVDALGGHDPYSASKAAAELVVQSYRRSFFPGDGALLASARGGNVIGGGDWSEDRLIADAARAVVGGKPLIVRHPDATRPWQHVLDCLSGYLSLAGALLERRPGSDTAYNFGPPSADNLAVGDLLDRLKHYWPGFDWRAAQDAADRPHEAGFLYLDSAKALGELGWASRWPLGTTLHATADWYQATGADPASAGATTMRQLDEFLSP